MVKGDKEGRERTYTVISLANSTISEEQKTEVVGSDRNKLMPYRYRNRCKRFPDGVFPDVLDYNFTASVERV